MTRFLFAAGLSSWAAAGCTGVVGVPLAGGHVGPKLSYSWAAWDPIPEEAAHEAEERCAQLGGHPVFRFVERRKPVGAPPPYSLGPSPDYILQFRCEP